MDHSIKIYWILFSIGSIGYSFHFISNENAKQVVEGNSLNLICHISSEVIDCSWQHENNKSFLFSNKDDYYLFFGNRSNGECHLQILKANSIRDNGVWTCQMTTANKVNISTQINITVLPRDFVHIKEDSNSNQPRVFIGAFCAAMFTIGGLITIYFYKKKSPCCLAPPGYSSRSMLIKTTSSEPSRSESSSDNRI